MDCLQAQSVISEALDRAPVDAALLEEAKAHCRTCSECATFVSALAAIQRTPAPQPPAGLAGKIMDALAIELVRDRAEQARAETRADFAPTAVPGEPPAPRSIKERLADPRARKSVIAWASAAAIVFIAAGFGAVAGVRQILAPPQQARTSGYGTPSDSVAGMAAPQADTLAAPESAQEGAQDKAVVTGQAPGFIAVNGTAYRLTSAVETTVQPNFRRVGSTRTALEQGGASTTLEVYSLPGQNRIFVKRPSDGALVAFDPVVRTFRNTTYALQTGDIPALGAWPTLPSSIPEPRPDGSPTFTYVEKDSSGNAIYRLSNATVDRGIALGPGTSSSDPAASNPNWTWWAPVR